MKTTLCTRDVCFQEPQDEFLQMTHPMIGADGPIQSLRSRWSGNGALVFFSRKMLLHGRQANGAEFMAQFPFDISYRPGTENPIADMIFDPKGAAGSIAFNTYPQAETKGNGRILRDEYLRCIGLRLSRRAIRSGGIDPSGSGRTRLSRQKPTASRNGMGRPDLSLLTPLIA